MFIIKQNSESFVDACVRNEAGQLIFMSVFGRDTSNTGLMARMQLGADRESNGGLGELTLVGAGEHQGELHTVTVGDARRLDKYTGRIPSDLIHNLSHMWIFDPCIAAPNKSTLQAWIIEPTSPHADPDSEAALRAQAALATKLESRIWDCVVELSSVPLLPHWRESVLAAMRGEMLFNMHESKFCQPVGNITAHCVRLKEDFPELICTMVKTGKLHLQPDVKLLQAA
jgi:hypothetical protein